MAHPDRKCLGALELITQENHSHAHMGNTFLVHVSLRAVLKRWQQQLKDGARKTTALPTKIGHLRPSVLVFWTGCMFKFAKSFIGLSFKSRNLSLRVCVLNQTHPGLNSTSAGIARCRWQAGERKCLRKFIAAQSSGLSLSISSAFQRVEDLNNIFSGQ